MKSSHEFDWILTNEPVRSWEWTKSERTASENGQKTRELLCNAVVVASVAIFAFGSGNRYFLANDHDNGPTEVRRHSRVDRYRGMHKSLFLLLSMLWIDWLLLICAKLSICRVTKAKEVHSHVFFLFSSLVDFNGTFYIMYSSDWSRFGAVFRRLSFLEYVEQCCQLKASFSRTLYIDPKPSQAIERHSRR
jgi:hypothetical protein